jgi:hypothetical protein
MALIFSAISYRVGHLDGGTYNFIFLESPQVEEPFRQIHDVEAEAQDLYDIVVHEVPDEDDSTTEMQASELAAVEKSGQQRTTTTSSNKQEKGRKEA